MSPILELVMPARSAPVAWTGGGLVVALLLAMLLTVVIRRREAARVPAQPRPDRIQSQRIQRATNAEVPDDLQKRLRTLTADLDRSLSDAVTASPSSGKGRAAMPDDATDFFGDDPYTGAGRPSDSTAAFGAYALRPSEDSTVHFDGVDATEFFGEDEAPAPGPALGNDDATRFFSGVEALPEPAETRFFADSGPDAEPAPDHGLVVPSQPNLSFHDDAATGFFDDRGASPDGTPSATRFFDGVDALPPSDPAGTTLFPADNDVAPAAQPGGTRFFTPDDHHDVSMADGPAEGVTGMLQALPPSLAPVPASMDPAPPVAPQSSGALHALPHTAERVDAGSLNRVQACLAGLREPNVVALCVLDGSGRYVAGEIDDDFTGELRALLAEAATGSSTDIDQPVRLGDDSKGALLLMPTGMNALLGALVLESEDQASTRAGLRALARQIGDAMRRAS